MYLVVTSFPVYTFYNTSQHGKPCMGLTSCQLLNIHSSSCSKRPTKCPTPQLRALQLPAWPFFLLNNWPSLVNAHSYKEGDSLLTDPKAFCAAQRRVLFISKPARKRAGLGGRRKTSWQEDRCILDAKQKLICFTTAAPEKINFDTELPLYKKITILSNNLICAKPTENSLKNQ